MAKVTKDWAIVQDAREYIAENKIYSVAGFRDYLAFVCFAEEVYGDDELAQALALARH